MLEIEKKDPESPVVFEDTIQHLVVSTTQRLRVCLLVLDHLLAIHNGSIESRHAPAAQKLFLWLLSPYLVLAVPYFVVYST